MNSIRTTPHNVKGGALPLLAAVFLLVAVQGLGAQGAGYAGRTVNPEVLGSPAISPSERPPLVSAGSLGATLFPKADAATPAASKSPTLLPAVAESHSAIFPLEGQPAVITYRVKKGDTLPSIARSLGVLPADLKSSNPSAGYRLKAGQKLTIAFAVADAVSPASAAPDAAPGFAITLAAAKKFFGSPAEGFNWSKLHSNNAVDIANMCGTPIVASSDGIAVSDPDYPDNVGDWNGGYGRFVLLEHSNDTRTRYAHLDKILVSVGDLVKRGQQVGTMGQTGDATGCHVHFEVLGAPNPFAK